MKREKALGIMKAVAGYWTSMEKLRHQKKAANNPVLGFPGRGRETDDAINKLRQTVLVTDWQLSYKICSPPSTSINSSVGFVRQWLL